MLPTPRARLRAPSYFYSFVFNYSPPLASLKQNKTPYDLCCHPTFSQESPETDPATSEPLEILTSFVSLRWSLVTVQMGGKTKSNEIITHSTMGFVNIYPEAFFFSRCSTRVWLQLQYTKNLTHWPRWVVQETCRKGSIWSQRGVRGFTDPSERFTSLQN